MIKSIGLAAFLTVGAAYTYAHADNAAAAPATLQIDGDEIELARYAKALIGAGNVTVEIAPYKKGSRDGAILLFHGVEGDWDGKAINHRVEDTGYGGLNYVAQYEGKRWVTLVMRKDEDGKPKYELDLPGVKDGIALAPSDGAAQLTTPKKIFDEYQKQLSQK